MGAVGETFKAPSCSGLCLLARMLSTESQMVYVCLLICFQLYINLLTLLKACKPVNYVGSSKKYCSVPCRAGRGAAGWAERGRPEVC